MIDRNHAGWGVFQKELLALSTVLGEPLTDDEAAEALVSRTGTGFLFASYDGKPPSFGPFVQVAMDTDHDNRVDVNEVIAFWLGERITEH